MAVRFRQSLSVALRMSSRYATCQSEFIALSRVSDGRMNECAWLKMQMKDVIGSSLTIRRNDPMQGLDAVPNCNIITRNNKTY